MNSEFTEVKMVDNFYQSSSFFPMPVVLISTRSESGRTNLGPYSLCFPHVVTGGSGYAMMLIARGTSNTAQNIIRTKTCSINFIPDKKKYMKNCVALGFPGESTEEKMKNSIFTLLPSNRPDSGGRQHPEIVREAEQVFDCTWDDSYPLKDRDDLVECHFLLRIESILLKQKWYQCLLKCTGFPRLPVDYGFRDNIRFWFSRHSRPYKVSIPKDKGNSFEMVKYACTHFDPEIVWEDEACAKILKVPGIFLKTVISGVVKEAKKEGITTITPAFMDTVRNKRSGK
jgi:flavin reductase (DIM6/NTAB) family NADH-FMN oxidoreductase RutF